MGVIVSDRKSFMELASMLEAFSSPGILVSANYEILAANILYRQRYGDIDLTQTKQCFNVSHGYSVPCDQAGEDCPLAAAMDSGHKERVLHIHNTPRGKEHVDVEMLPIFDVNNELIYFVELLHDVPIASVKDSASVMVGASAAFNAMVANITRVSATDAAVLLLGGSGTGKELAAAAIHNGSARKHKIMITLECSGLTDSLFESELFGHVKGAFTGAHADRKGLAELVDGGTLFLDEIGDVPLSMQVKLLRLLESGTFRAVGSAKFKSTNFRLICATHKNLLQMVNEGLFRQDLFYRINVFPIKVPSLAERVDDIPVLCESLLKHMSPNKAYYLTDPAMRLIKSYPFPGNIRELKNILNRAIVLTDTNLIGAQVIDDSLAIDAYQATNTPQSKSAKLTCKKTEEGAASPEWVDLKAAEKQYISQLMDAHNGDKAVVAAIAGISLRSLYRKLDGDD